MMTSTDKRSCLVSLPILLATFYCLLQSVQANSIQRVEEENIDKIDWWKKTNFYHIYIRSFRDTDGDGQGDFRGVIEKLDYLKSLGVETLLLSPFYSSPMRDGGYDIDDYTAINPLFGTMEDFEDLVAGLKERSMRLVVDFVPNHSSNDHKWFQCSERALIDPKNCGRYKDYYVWSNSTRFQNSRPNNWISLFGGATAWRWSDVRKEFYFHQFLPEQPDLNLRNPLVREEFKEIARFWLRKGVNGLRVDAVLHFLEDVELRDEPLNPKWQPHWDPYDRLLHKYTRSMSESATVVKDWYQVANEAEFKDLKPVIITEAYDEIPKLIEYYGPKPSERFAHMPFDFQLLLLDRDNLTAKAVQESVVPWLESTRQLKWPNENGARSPWSCWVTGNHDNKRAVNRVGDSNADFYRWLAFLLPGVPVAYYGDEIGMHDANFNKIPLRTVEEGEPTRLVFRAPMAWSPEKPSAGFSSSSHLWMPLNDNYETNNVETYSASEAKNHLNNFVGLQKVRREQMETLTFGDLVFYDNQPIDKTDIFAMARTHRKFGNLLLIVNFDTFNRQVLHLRQGRSLYEGLYSIPPQQGQILLLNYDAEEIVDQVTLREGLRVNIEGLVLGPNQAAIIKY